MVDQFHQLQKGWSEGSLEDSVRSAHYIAVIKICQMLYKHLQQEDRTERRERRNLETTTTAGCKRLLTNAQKFEIKNSEHSENYNPKYKEE